MTAAILSLRVTATAPPPDPTLVTDLRRGNPAALGAVYRAHAPMLLRTALHITGTRADAEDVVQDLFVALPEAAVRYDERGRFDAWLRGICVRLALQRVRAARRWSDDDTLAGMPAPARSSLEDRLTLEAALAALPDALRVVFVLRDIEGYTHAEIAGLLGIRRNTSEVRHHRAIRHLRALMGDRA